ncbi:HRQ1 [Candida pseudojiufengensis]|uniref:HRQ1 n=1 Tax=Candida pseudojiufengensis TaxID=497109 RepID=UPI0022253C88|nr:HRQ1 [Candida pseudojiufengensis]KAI5962303.1 HRQ1 [Candida pseudojiufengensis]
MKRRLSNSSNSPSPSKSPSPITESWSPFFQRLIKIFHEINTHLTFLSSHSKSVIPSIQLIQKLNNSITETDLAVIKFLFPEDEILFDYFDENQVMVALLEEVSTGKKGYDQKLMAEKYDIDDDNEEPKTSKQILIFDFQDVKIHGIGKIVKGRKKLRKQRHVEYDTSRRQSFFLNDTKSLLVPIEQVNLTKMIQGRDSRFKKYLDSFIKLHGEDAEDIIVKKALPLIPEPPNLDDIVEILEGKENTIEEKNLITTDDMINALKNSSSYSDQISSIHQLNYESPAKYLDPPEFHPELEELIFNNVDSLYTHQSEALHSLLNDGDNSHVIVSTSTASGKSFIYQIPVLNSILWDITNGLKGRNTTALFIFPTKALAQDQIRHFQKFLNQLPSNSRRPIIINTYDGDTPFAERKKISTESDILFTNPDTIHASILPNNKFDSWLDFTKALKYVVVDELHIYKGTFGINVGYVMARLQRIKNKFDTKIKFISCSATIGNPVNHFRTICSIPKEDKVIHVSNDGSARCEKKLIIWNPPVLMNQRGEKGPADSSSNLIPRVGMMYESAKLLLTLLTELKGIKVIVFCPIRVVVESVMREVRHLLQNSFSKSGINQSEIMAYRGGYSKSDRRIIEKKMFGGQLRAIVATNALELGIDLSDLDVVITCGFPMSKSNLHQQFGRAGRGKNAKGSLAIYVVGKSPVDQYYLENSEELVHNTYEDLCVDGLRDMEHGSLLLERHLQCAAYEDPIHLEEDYRWFSHGRSFKEFEKILNEHLIKDVGDRYITHTKYMPKPTKLVPIRAIDDTTVAVVDITNGRNVIIEEVEWARTFFTIYEGGIFLHQGQSYLVKEFNFDQKYAKVERVNVDWTTSQRDYTDVDPEEVELVKPLATKAIDLPVFFGAIKIVNHVFGFFKVNRKEEILEVVEVDNPPIVSFAKGVWLNVPKLAIDIIKSKKLSAAGGIHAAEHAIMNMLPIYINTSKANTNMADFEMGTECKAPQKEFKSTESTRKRPARLIFYDTKGNRSGSGYSYKTFECIDELLQTTFDRIRTCQCNWGCPLCIIGNTCREQSIVMSRPASLLVLGSFLGIDLIELANELPDGPEPGIPAMLHNTIAYDTTSVRFSPNVKILNLA